MRNFMGWTKEKEKTVLGATGWIENLKLKKKFDLSGRLKLYGSFKGDVKVSLHFGEIY